MYKGATNQSPLKSYSKSLFTGLIVFLIILNHFYGQ